MPRLSDLLHSRVETADGEVLGSVDDVRLVQDGPALAGIDASLRVDALIVGRGGLAVRLGVHRHKVRGPLPIKRLFGALERSAWVVPWEDVAAWEGDVVRLSRARDDVRRVADVY